MSILPLLRSALRGLALPSPARVVVAVSGGPDSLCLLHALHALRDDLRLQLHVAHLDHAFRGDESAAEAAFVATFARQLGLPATVERRDVPALVAHDGVNAQAAARAVRYGFLAEVAVATGAHAVAVAHHADDQAETVLLHLLRGAGPAGLRGMRAVVAWEEWAANDKVTERQGDRVTPSSDSSAEPLPRILTPSPPHPLTPSPLQQASGASLIRPLLAARRAEIEAYCAEHRLEPRRDPSNASPRYARSRVRAGLLPVLAEYNPQVVEQLAHTAAICADDYDFLQRQLDARWPALVAAQRDGYVEFDGEAWRDLHPALQRYALRRAALLLGGEEPGFAHVEAARHVALLAVGARCDLPNGVTLVVGYNGFALQRGHSDESAEQPQLQADELPAAVPGVTELGGGWRIEVWSSETDDWSSDRWSALLDADALGQPLALRARRPGDRIRLAGGTRSLQNLFVDEKLPRALRARWPLLVSPAGIAWVVGVRVDARFAASERTARRLWVRCVRFPDTTAER
jgi:tRNA(Ile)-lysidine synthetase-like protein